MIKVKVCGLTDPDNVQEIAGLIPDFMGFIFYPGSKRFVGNIIKDSLFSNIPSGILKTGVFVNEEPSRILNIMNLYGLDLVQLHGDETAEYCSFLKQEGLKVIKAFSIDENVSFETLEQYLNTCEYFLFDTKSDSTGGSGIKFDWRKISEYTLDMPFFLGGGIGPEDAPLVKQLNHKWLIAVDINSRFEKRPGIKDYIKVKKFIYKIRQ
jgi:phosphoribosylanthranilate isomerase